MIYTQFGSEVRKIIGFEERTGLVNYIRESDGVSRWINKASLKADGGLKEIEDAIEQAQAEKGQS